MTQSEAALPASPPPLLKAVVGGDAVAQPGWEEVARQGSFGRRMLAVRAGLKISQQGFANRFGLTLAAVKHHEQDRGKPSRALAILLETIALDPELVRRAARKVGEK